MRQGSLLVSLGLLLGYSLVILAGAALIPLVAAFSDPPGLAGAFWLAILSKLAVACLLLTACRGLPAAQDVRVAFALPPLWFAACSLAAALPFAYAGVLGPGAAWFEALSALSTTAASQFADSREVPRSLLMWQGVLAFLGGWATVVAVLAIARPLNVGGLRLMPDHFPPGRGRGLFDRLHGVAGRAATLYGALAGLAFVLLLVAGLTPFDALRSGLSGLATAGYRPLVDGDLSLGAQVALAVLMLAGAINPTLYWPILSARPWLVPSDGESRGFAAFIAVTALILALIFAAKGDASLLGSLWRGLFQAVSIVSTTGLSVPPTVPALPLEAAIVAAIAVLVGGCAGSTAGGLKILRLRLLTGQAERELARLAYPSRALPVRYGGQRLSAADVSGLWLALMATLTAFSFGTLAMALDGTDPRGSLALALAGLTNAGALAWQIDPDFLGYAGVSGVQKSVIGLLSIIGRVDAVLVSVLILRGVWQR